MFPPLKISACALLVFGCAQTQESNPENNLWTDPASFPLSTAEFILDEEFLAFTGERDDISGLGSGSVMYVGPSEVALGQLALQTVITPWLISSKEEKLKRASNVILESFGASINDLRQRKIYRSLIAQSESNEPSHQVLLTGFAEISQGADTVILITQAAVRDKQGADTLPTIQIAAIGRLDAGILDLSAEARRVTMLDKLSELGQLTGTVLMGFFPSIREKCGQKVVNRYRYRRGERMKVLLARQCESIENWAVFYSDHQGFTVIPASWLRV